MRIKICDSHLLRKVASKCLYVRERVEVVEWNKRWSPSFTCCPVSSDSSIPAKENPARKKDLPPEKKSMLMKIVRANYISYALENCLNQHFEIPNPYEYGWKICDGKLKPNWFEGPVLPSFEEINQEQNNLNSLSDRNQ